MGGVPQSGDLQAAVFCFELSLLTDVRAAEKLGDKCSWRGSKFFSSLQYSAISGNGTFR